MGYTVLDTYECNQFDTATLGRHHPRLKSMTEEEGPLYVDELNGHIFVTNANLQVREHRLCFNLEREELR